MAIQVNADLRPLIEKSLDSGPRGDELHAHISDLGFCDLSTWARRNDKPQLKNDAATLWKFALGHAVEAKVAEGIIAAAGPLVTRGDRIAWDPTDLKVRFIADDAVPCAYEVVGHLDLLSIGWVGEVKSVWFARAPQTEPKPGHVLQAAGYATALGIEDFFIQYVSVTLVGRKTELQLSETFWLKAAPYRDRIIERARQVIALGPGTWAPRAEPPEAWQCGYCRYKDCTKNANPMRNK